MPWKDDLPEAVQEWDEVKNAETPEAFFDQMANLRSAIGQSVRIPGEDASDEDKSAFYKSLETKVPGVVRMPETDEDFAAMYRSLGQPEETTGYSVPQSDLAMDEGMVGEFRKQAHAAGLSLKQFEKIISGFATFEQGKAEVANTTLNQGLTELKNTWGSTYDEQMAAATVVREQYFPFIPKDMPMNAETVKAFASLAKQLGGESQGLNLTPGHQTGAMTPGDAQLKISEIMSNKQHPYWNRRDPAHKAAREKMTKLSKYAYPG